jgi:hypothetical protein
MVVEIVLDDEVLALVQNACTGRSALREPRAHEQRHVLAGEVGVLLAAGERELLLDDLPGRHEPGVVVARRAQVGERAERVEAGYSGTGRRRPVASSHGDDGPGRMRMPWPGQIGSQLRMPST